MGPPVSDCFVVITILQDKGPFFYGLWRLHKKFYTMHFYQLADFNLLILVDMRTRFIIFFISINIFEI